jgi:short-subunit dehydrogenase
MNIFGQRILITGAAGGIGSALAMALANEGATLLLADLDVNKLEQIKQAVLSQQGKAMTFPCDLSLPHAAGSLAHQVTDMAGGVDILINCAGIISFGQYEDLSPDSIEKLWRINVMAPMQLAQALLPQMKARRHGRIVNIGSIFGSIGFAYFTPYSTSKFAMRGFSEALRRELAGTGVEITYVAPRYTQTPLNDGPIHRMANAVGMNSDSPSTVAAVVMKAIRKDRKDVYIGWPECFFVRVNALLPRLVDNALRGQNATAKTFAIHP